jgi:hypothetical protein
MDLRRSDSTLACLLPRLPKPAKYRNCLYRACNKTFPRFRGGTTCPTRRFTTKWSEHIRKHWPTFEDQCAFDECICDYATFEGGELKVVPESHSSQSEAMVSA